MNKMSERKKIAIVLKILSCMIFNYSVSVSKKRLQMLYEMKALIVSLSASLKNFCVKRMGLNSYKEFHVSNNSLIQIRWNFF